MGIVRAKIKLSNPMKSELQALEVDAVVDTGCTYLAITEEQRLQLKLEVISEREVTVATGQPVVVPYAGPIKVEFKGRVTMLCAIVTGNEALLGAMVMEDLDLVIRPAALSIDVNPASPNIPSGLAK
ncbi:MAG: clan AA aspartic protease [Nitrospinae bacterium]|nr:clan AA aspartic protease [Nitrospinota bacterium]